MNNGFLPITREDMTARGWEQADFVYVIGDAYVDHPSFGPAIISRVLEAHGFKVAIISQPDWKDETSIQTFGRPRLGFLVSGGNMDSMVNHYSVSKKRRQSDAYTPGGVGGKRPDYATIVYCQLIRKVYKNVPIVIGGIEASLRRMAHYDYWSDKLKHSILIDSGADILSYGMGEKSIVAVAEALEAGIPVQEITFVRGTVYKCKQIPDGVVVKELPSYQELKADKLNYARSFYIQYCNTDSHYGKCLAEKYEDFYVVQNPASEPLTQQEMDDVYALPYMRTYHPSYEALGGVPAISEIKFSLISNRGCFGGCSFCALTFHQGRTVQVRSHESIVDEAKRMIQDKDFKGYIHDVGGPTANFRRPSCQKQLTKGVCPNKQCLFPQPCQNLEVDHSDYIQLLRKLRALPGVKKVFIRSGLRFDYMLADKDDSFMRELCQYHVSGQLKVAPEHVSEPVLRRMGKPANTVYQEFSRRYKRVNEQMGLKQYLVPYLMSSHPGCGMKEAVELAEFVRDLGYMPEQVQDFYPTPSTISTCMYYTGVDPRTMEPVYVPKNPHEKALQRALIQYRDPKNRDLIEEALTMAGRRDLIGYDKKCLIRPKRGEGSDSAYAAGGRSASRGAGAGKNQKQVNGRESAKQIGKQAGQKSPQQSGKGQQSGKTGRQAGPLTEAPQKKKTIRNVHKKKTK